MTRLEQIEGCRFKLEPDGEFEVLTVRRPAGGNDPVDLTGNEARIRYSDMLLASADALLTGLVPRNVMWQRAQELAVRMAAEYRRLKEQQS